MYYIYAYLYRCSYVGHLHIIVVVTIWWHVLLKMKYFISKLHSARHTNPGRVKTWFRAFQITLAWSAFACFLGYSSRPCQRAWSSSAALASSSLSNTCQFPESLQCGDGASQLHA